MMRAKNENRAWWWGVALACAASAVAAAEQPSYSPWAGKDLPQRVYWGDTHLHTSLSLDANLFGAAALTPADAYRFARGETITASHGMAARIGRPLDFLVVADHAEYLGVMRLVRAGDPAILRNETARGWREALLGGQRDSMGRMMIQIGESYATGKPLVDIPEGHPSPWRESAQVADAANRPGEFTALIGYEWSSAPDGNNLHRVVVFRDGAERTSQVAPYSSFDSENPEELWRYLARYEQATGGRALAIPHNSNLSGGLMFSDKDFGGKPIDAAYARERARWEPVIEVTQIKGDSETHPLQSPGDAFADYGRWDQFNILMNTPQQPWMQQHQYARPALRLGLAIEERTGENPYRFGLIGSTDSHTALAAVEEENFWGKAAHDEPGPLRTKRPWGIPEAGMPNTIQLASGYAAVWATQNTREAIFDALARREVYASTGPRITVRFFGGWNYGARDLAGPNPALNGYARGVPMGADLPARPQDARAPSFLVWALKETDGANLDRVQVVKGWVDGQGETHEKVFDVAWSGAREPDADGVLPPVGTTVDVATATWSNDIGAAELATVWSDPEFDPAARAFYYVRVLEIPTPRWVLYDRLRLGVELPAGTELVHQERAYTSPIWYEPRPRG
ncbi:MAG: hypothetical protein CALGDGBN_03077 [Pseudomonadales bacterium]|nr:hypothetical protein [Pseudomonadales bacterium]